MGVLVDDELYLPNELSVSAESEVLGVKSLLAVRLHCSLILKTNFALETRILTDFL